MTEDSSAVGQDLAALHTLFEAHSATTLQYLQSTIAHLESIGARMDQRLSNLQNLMENELLAAQQRHDAVMAGVQSQLAELRKDVLDAVLSTRRLLADPPVGPVRDAGETRVPDPCPIPLERQSAELQARCPHAFRLWSEASTRAEAAYRSAPIASLSVAGNVGAGRFGAFIQPLLHGLVLDIGCGSASVPWYLKGYPSQLMAGLDPYGAVDDHPFRFVRSFAEFVPWEDGTFDCVVAASSLDHVLLLEKTLTEVCRVLKPGGKFLVWVAFVKGAKAYDPGDPNLVPEDAYHLFHFDKGWFEPLFARYFDVEESLSPDQFSYFYCFQPRHDR